MKMAKELLTQNEARKIVDNYIAIEGDIRSTQEILDSGEVPKLKGFIVRPGKVSDSIFGGKGSYTDKSTGKEIEFENPPLEYNGMPLRLMVRTERISTHDINRGSIPFKDQILAANHNYMRRLLEDAIGTSQIEVDGLADNAVVIAAEDLQQIAFENVLRAFMAKSSTSTSLYQAFKRGEREFCGYELPGWLVTNGHLPYVMDTPSTKSDEHDLSVEPQYLFDNGICTSEEYAQIRNGSIYAFGMVAHLLGEKGLIAVDTKTEHGRNSVGEIVSQDEIWTMDSSRFWLADDYKDQVRKFNSGEIDEISPRSYSKEFARGFSEGEQGYTREQRAAIAVRYIEGIQHLLGQRFEPDMRPRDERVVTGLQTVVNQLIE
jgi:phosphoribosylaminoimidazole-succinocarboxamide synthase